MGVGLVASVLLILLGTWLFLMMILTLVRPRDIDLREATRLVPDVARLIGRLARDPSLGWGPRVRLLVLFAYLASPIDIVPDFVPVVGYADDVIVVAVALRSVVRHAGAEALHEHWGGSAAGLAVVRRLAGLDPSP